MENEKVDCLVLPEIHHLYIDSFLARVVASVLEEAHLNNMKLLIESTADEQTRGYTKLAKGGRVDGLIVVNPRENDYDELAQINQQIMPLVVFGSQRRSAETASEFSTTGSNNFINAKLAVRHLIGLGHARIAHIGFASSAFVSVNSRERGWLSALEEAGLSGEGLKESAELSAESGYEACQRLLRGKKSFSAIFAGNDTVAFGIIKALTDQGLRIPDDVATLFLVRSRVRSRRVMRRWTWTPCSKTPTRRLLLAPMSRPATCIAPYWSKIRAT